MKWKILPLFALGLILGVICTGCSSSSNAVSGSLTITASTLPTGTVGTAYSYSLPATGGTPPYVWSLNSGTLPAGLKLSSKGTISGTPVAAGTVAFTVAAIDSEAVPASTTANFSITIQSELAVTSLSLPAGAVGINYSTALAAAGGVSPYTWSLTGGNLPAGLNLSASGVISGKPTASGAATFTVQVVDSGTTQQTAVAQLTIAIDVVTITTASLPNATVNVLYSAPLAAAGGVTPYSWTLSGTLPSGLSLNSAGVISGTPISTGTATFTVHVADSESPPATAGAQLSITVNSGGSAGSLQGNYAFYLNGFNPAGAWTIAGSFIADGNGNITSGIVDANSVAGSPLTATITGTCTTNASGLNTITIQGQSWGPMTLAFVLDSTGNGRLIEYDDKTGQGDRGSGVLRKANASVFSVGGLTGNWTFGLTGAGEFGERFVDVGQFTVATGTISNGACDTNDGGDYQTCTFTGTVSAVDPRTGRATASISNENGINNEVIYVVSLGELVMEQVDPVALEQGASVRRPFSSSSGGSPVLVGSGLGQNGSLGNSSLKGATVLHMQGIQQADGLDQSVAGIVSFDGNGNFSITAMDEDLAGTITQDQWLSSTYSVASNGAVTINCQNGDCPAGFLTTTNQGFFVSTGADTSFGVMDAQSSGAFSNASMAGSYSGSSLAPLDYTNAINAVYAGSADGLGTFTESSDSSGFGGLGQSSANVASYSMATTGRGMMQSQENQASAVVYMISPTKWIVLEPTTDARVDLYQH
jgi:hypothetical protein